MPPIHVALVEDDPGYANAIQGLLTYSQGFESAGVYSTGESAILSLQNSPAHVAAIDLILPDMEGTQCIQKLKDLNPKLRILVLSQFGEIDKILTAIQAGAEGYVLKADGFAAFLEATKAVYNGDGAMSPAIASRIIQLLRTIQPAQGNWTANPRNQSLSEREQAVLKLVEKGYRTKEISAQLSIQPSTVANHLTAIYRKLGITGIGRNQMRKQKKIS